MKNVRFRTDDGAPVALAHCQDVGSPVVAQSN
jgi:hypothetical protein